MGKNLKRLKRPKPEKEQKPFASPKLGEMWIEDVAAKLVIYPTTMARFKKRVSQLRDQQRQIKTFQDV